MNTYLSWCIDWNTYIKMLRWKYHSGVMKELNWMLIDDFWVDWHRDKSYLPYTTLNVTLIHLTSFCFVCSFRFVLTLLPFYSSILVPSLYLVLFFNLVFLILYNHVTSSFLVFALFKSLNLQFPVHCLCTSVLSTLQTARRL
jgi:hypothetical protein